MQDSFLFFLINPKLLHNIKVGSVVLHHCYAIMRLFLVMFLHDHLV